MSGAIRRRRLPHSSVAVWPSGTDGDLTVPSGTTVITQGLIYNYRNITIEVGGTLRIANGNGTTPTIIGWSGVFTNNGTINTTYGTSTAPTAIYSNTAPDGYTLSQTVEQQYGGDAGLDGGFGGNGFGSAEGGGGGGGPFSASADGRTDGSGGTGGVGSPAAQGTVGAGGTLYSGIGGNGGSSSANQSVVIGGGGGGGAKGYHGIGLYLKGGPLSSTAGTGSVTSSGGQAGAGGNGGNSHNLKTGAGLKLSYGAGGGGGGAGGSGGRIVARFKTSAPAWTYSMAGSIGGLGGSGGIATADDAGATIADGLAGTSGANGSVGSTDIATY